MSTDVEVVPPATRGEEARTVTCRLSCRGHGCHPLPWVMKCGTLTCRLSCRGHGCHPLPWVMKCGTYTCRLLCSVHRRTLSTDGSTSGGLPMSTDVEVYPVSGTRMPPSTLGEEVRYTHVPAPVSRTRMPPSTLGEEVRRACGARRLLCSVHRRTLSTGVRKS